MEFGGEVHLESAGELGRSAEGEVDVLAENLGDVGARNLHPLGKVRLGNAQLLHAQKDLAQERRTKMVNGIHRLLDIRSRPMGYAVKYLTPWPLAELTWDRFMESQSFMCVF